MNRLFIFFCLFVIFIQIALIAFFERNFFLTSYDVSYWKDRYEHSQYQLPLSKRIVGDDGLFAYAGYRLIKGDNPFSINVDKPPVGKYLIGVSILLFKNPAYYALFLGLGSFVLFYLIAKMLLGKTSFALAVAALLFLDPLFFTQFWKPWLDIAQLFFLLMNLFLIVKITPQKKSQGLLFILLAGFFLGMFIETKPPILFPLIFLLESILLLLKKIKKQYLLFILGIFIGVLVPYFRYFQLGFGPIDFLKIHKYMTSIYLKSQLVVHKEAIWQTLFFGRFPDIATGSPTIVTEWWILWPILVICGIGISFFFLLKKNVPVFLRGLAIFLLATLFIYTIIPSYPRYLLLVLPIFYLFLIKTVEQFIRPSRQYFFLALFLFLGIINTIFFLQPKPGSILDNFYYNLSHQYFQDIYQEDLVKAGRPAFGREEFRRVAQKALLNANVSKIEIKEKERIIPKVGNKGKVSFEVTYKTQDLGLFFEEKTIELVKENEEWKIKWNWDLVFNNFSPDYTIETRINLGKRGAIFNSEGVPLVQDAPGFLISINPEKIDRKREEEMLKFIESYNYRNGVDLQNAYLENALPGEYVPLITLHTPISEKERNKFLSYPGLKLTEDYPSRVYYPGLSPKSVENTSYKECCTRIYSSYNYHGIMGLEKDYDKILAGYSGGVILMKNKDGEVIKTIFEKTTKNGGDVYL